MSQGFRGVALGEIVIETLLRFLAGNLFGFWVLGFGLLFDDSGIIPCDEMIKPPPPRGNTWGTSGGYYMSATSGGRDNSTDNDGQDNDDVSRPECRRNLAAPVRPRERLASRGSTQDQTRPLSS
jgi:hypothetical protein